MATRTFGSVPVSDSAWNSGWSPRRVQSVIVGANLNAEGTNIGTWTNLPSKYRVLGLIAFDKTGTIATPQIAVWNDSGASDKQIVNNTPVSLAATTTIQDFAIAYTSELTAATLYLSNPAANGSAATASFLLEVMDLS